MALVIGGKTIDTAALETPAGPVEPGERVRVAVEHLTIHVMLDGAEILKAVRTIENIELVADLLSAYGYPRQATQLRKAKNIPRKAIG